MHPNEKLCKNVFLNHVNALAWFAKPPWLSPPNCARYGWENVAADVLRCVGCKAHISGHMPPAYQPVVCECVIREVHSTRESKQFVIHCKYVSSVFGNPIMAIIFCREIPTLVEPTWVL